MMAAHSNQWSAGSAAQAAPMPQQQQQGDGYGLQAKPMGCEQRNFMFVSAPENDTNMLVLLQ